MRLGIYRKSNFQCCHPWRKQTLWFSVVLHSQCLKPSGLSIVSNIRQTSQDSCTTEQGQVPGARASFPLESSACVLNNSYQVRQSKLSILKQSDNTPLIWPILGPSPPGRPYLRCRLSMLSPLQTGCSLAPLSFHYCQGYCMFLFNKPSSAQMKGCY